MRSPPAPNRSQPPPGKALPNPPRHSHRLGIVRVRPARPGDAVSYLGTGDHVARTIAANGLRLVLDEHRTTTTPTLKSGKPGKTKVTYGDVDDAVKWLWRFVDGAKTAGELFWGSEAGTGVSVVAVEACVGASFCGGWFRPHRVGSWGSCRGRRRCPLRVALRSAFVRQAILATGAFATARMSWCPRRTCTCGSCVMAAAGRLGRRRSTRGTWRCSLTGAPCGASG